MIFGLNHFYLIGLSLPLFTGLLILIYHCMGWIDPNKEHGRFVQWVLKLHTLKNYFVMRLLTLLFACSIPIAMMFLKKGKIYELETKTPYTLEDCEFIADTINQYDNNANALRTKVIGNILADENRTLDRVILLIDPDGLTDEEVNSIVTQVEERVKGRE